MESYNKYLPVPFETVNCFEVWFPVKDYEGIYEVSNLYRVKSLKFGKEKILRLTRKKNGYIDVQLWKEGKMKSYRVHRLVWEAFKGEIEDGMVIDHLNTIRDDCRLINLKSVTPKENSNNPSTRKKHDNALKNLFSKPVLQLDKNTGEVIKEWASLAEAERNTGILETHISRVCLGKRKSAGGFGWRHK